MTDRPEVLPPAVLVLIVDVAKSHSEHFGTCVTDDQEWRDCDDCVDAYNKAHGVVMAAIDRRSIHDGHGLHSASTPSA